MAKKTSSRGGVRVVPNAKLPRTSAKTQAEAAALLKQATDANRSKREYGLATKGKVTEVTVRNKDTGLVVSKFSVSDTPKNARLRKFKPKTRAGTISASTLFKAI